MLLSRRRVYARNVIASSYLLAKRRSFDRGATMGHLAFVCMCARASLSLPLSSRNWMSHASDKKLAAPIRKTGFFFLYLDETAAELSSSSTSSVLLVPNSVHRDKKRPTEFDMSLVSKILFGHIKLLIVAIYSFVIFSIFVSASVGWSLRRRVWVRFGRETLQ